MSTENPSDTVGSRSGTISAEARRLGGSEARRLGGSEARRLDEETWGTFGCERTVLVVARTLTSTSRLLEALALFRNDFRIRFLFTVNDASAFSAGIRRLLWTAGVDLIHPWPPPAEVSYDLALSASENIDFDALSSHTVVLPHGLGFHKYVPTADGDGVRLAGLPPDEILRTGKATVVLSHPRQREQLRAVAPAAAAASVCTGDPTLDRLEASKGQRAQFRRLLGTGDRTLIVVASTWRPDSVIGRWRALPAELLEALSLDRYQVCLLLHPNIWAFYGPVQIKLWLAEPLRAGLVLQPPETGWQAALVAADQLITDHGSLGLFGAALDLPLLLAGESDEIVPGTPIARLAEAAPRLHPAEPLPEQIDSARAGHRAGVLRAITADVFDRDGDASTRLRDLIYRKLDLAPPPDAPVLPRLPQPYPPACRITSFVVGTMPIILGELALDRRPAAVASDRRQDEHHLVVDETEFDLRLLERAAVIFHSMPGDVSDARRWAASTLADYPGARIAVAATATGCTATIRSGPVVSLTTDTDVDISLLASAIYCWYLTPTRPGEFTITAGAQRATVSLDHA